MTFAQRKQERRALMKHLLEQNWDVFGTLKFVDGRTIGRNTADKLLRSYWNRVDRVFFGHAADRQNMRVPRWCFAHEGSDSENFHIHFLLKSPLIDTKHTCTVLNAVWAQHHHQTGPLAKNWIMPVKDRWEVANYATREYWRMGSATVLDEISWDNKNSAEMAKYEHDAQAERIFRAASPLWLIAALGHDAVYAVFDLVKAYDDFTPDNDPYGEHDFGSFYWGEHQIFWKFDYFDLDFTMHSPDPADETVTARVLTVMLAEEY